VTISTIEPITRRFSRFLIDKWWLVYGASVVSFAALLAFLPPVPGAYDEFIFYPLVLYNGWGLVVSIFAGYALGCMLWGIKERSFGRPIALFVGSIVLSLTVGALIGLRSGMRPFSELHHVESERTNTYVYNLATNQFYDVIGPAYSLYECDSLGVNCHVVYRWRPYGYPDFYADRDNPAFLSVEDDRLNVHIAGEVVYSHRLPGETE